MVHSKMNKLGRLQLLYSQGRMVELKETICLTPEKKRTLEEKRLLAWALYRLKDYQGSFDLAVEINNIELISQIISHITKDNDRLMKALEMCPDNPSVWNAYVIRARDLDFKTFCMKKFFEKDDEFGESEEIGAINFRNNLARLLLAKGTHYKDIWVALGLWNSVLIRYGKENYHHRAEVCYRMHQAYSEIGEMNLAKEMARQSAELWEIQSKRDPQNLEFQKKYENALKIYQGL